MVAELVALLRLPDRYPAGGRRERGPERAVGEGQVGAGRAEAGQRPGNEARAEGMEDLDEEEAMLGCGAAAVRAELAVCGGWWPLMHLFPLAHGEGLEEQRGPQQDSPASGGLEGSELGYMQDGAPPPPESAAARGGLGWGAAERRAAELSAAWVAKQARLGRAGWGV
jgi:hypothetical protein